MNGNNSNQGSSTTAPSATPRKKRKLLLWIGGAVLILFVLLAGLVLAIPSILSGDFGRTRILRAVNDGIAGDVQIDSMKLSWFGGQSVKGIVVNDPQGKPVLSLDSVSTEASLWGLAVRRRYDLGRTELARLKADIVTDEAGRTNLEKAFAPKGTVEVTGATTEVATAPPAPERAPSKSEEPVRAPRSLTGEISLIDSEITLSAPGKDPVRFADLKGRLSVPDITQPVSLTLSTRTEQGGLSGGLSADGTIANLFGSDGTLTLDKANGNMVASGTDLPVDGIDQLMGMRGVLTAALGSPLNLDLNGNFATDKAAITLTGSSPNMKADVDADLSGGRLSLTRPAEAALTVTPELIRLIVTQQDPQSTLRLASAVPMKITIQELTSPLDGRNPGETSAKAGFTLGDARFTGDSTIGDVAVRNLVANIDIPKLADSITVHVQGLTEKDGQSGDIRVDADIKQLYAPDGSMNTDNMQVDVKANVDGFPMGPVDQIMGQKGLLVAALGSRLNLKANASTSGGQTQADVNLNSERITAQIPVVVGKTLELQLPAAINYSLTPGVAKRVLGATGPQLRNDVPIAINISKLSVPVARAGEPSFVPEKTIVQMTLTSGEMRVREPSLGNLTIRDLGAEFGGDSLAKTLVSVAAKVESSSPAFIAAIGPVAEAAVKASGGFKANGEANFPDIQLSIKSRNLNGDLSGKLTERFALAKPATLNLNLTPEALRELKIVKEDQPNLSAPASIAMTLDQLDVPISNPDYSTLKMAAKATISNLSLAGDERYKGVSLNDAAMTLNADGAANKAAMKIDGTTRLEGETTPGRIRVDAELNNIIRAGQLDLQGAATKATANIKSLPVALLETFSGQGGVLVPMVGPTLDVDLTANLPPGGGSGGVVDIKAKGERLNLDAGASLGDVLTLTRLGVLKLTITPQLFKLEEPMELNASVKSLRWPMVQKNRDQAFDPANTGIDAIITVPRLVFVDEETKRVTTLSALNAAVSGQNLAEPVNVNITGKVAADATQGTPARSGDINVSGQLTDLFKSNGEFNSEGFGASLRGMLSDLPVPPLDSAVGAQQHLVAVLGDVLGATGNVQVARNKGPITANLKSSNSSIRLGAHLEDDAITLREPLRAEVGVNPLLSKLILKNVNPLLINAIGGDPIRLSVARDGVYVPLDSKKLSALQIRAATLELGTMMLNNGGVLSGLLTLLKQSAAKQMTAEFTPLVARVTNGVAEYDRTDAIIGGSFHIATWGTVDLPKDQVDMVMGITAETLDKVFGLEGLSEDQMLQIPMRGPSSNVQVDWGRAGTQLATLIAQKQLTGKIPGGDLLGGLLGGGNKPPPPPPGGTTSGTAGESESGTAEPTKSPGGIVEGILGGLARPTAKPAEGVKAAPEATTKPATREEPSVEGIIGGILGGGRRGEAKATPVPRVEAAPATSVPVKEEPVIETKAAEAPAPTAPPAIAPSPTAVPPAATPPTAAPVLENTATPPAAVAQENTATPEPVQEAPATATATVTPEPKPADAGDAVRNVIGNIFKKSD